jgi:hypothetical protein
MTRAFKIVAAVALMWGLCARAQQAPGLAEGAKAFGQADYPSSFDIAQQVLTRTPNDPAALELKARSLLAMGEPAMAQSALLKLVLARGSVKDITLHALSLSLSGKAPEAEAALEAAEGGKEPTPESLYALACLKGGAKGRVELLRKIAAAFPDTKGKLAEETAFWEAKGPVAFNRAAPVPPEGIKVKLKTLWDCEWAVCRTGSGKELWLLVDTACPRTVLSNDAAKRLDLAVASQAFPSPGAFPEARVGDISFLDSLDLGGLKIENVPVQVVRGESGILDYREGRAVLKGILGMDLLRGCKVRFDRKKDELWLFPADAPMEKVLGESPAAWKVFPALFPYGQLYVSAMLGTKTKALGLVETGCSEVIVSAAAIPGTGLVPESKHLVNLNYRNFTEPISTVSPAEAGVTNIRPLVLGWIEACVRPAGTVQTVPTTSTVGVFGTKFLEKDIPLYPFQMGGDVPAVLLVGKKITDFYAVALDIPGGKIYVKQVLFAK